MLGDFLYGLQPQEAISAPVVQRANDRRLVSSALANNNFEWQVPLGKAYLLIEATVKAATAGVALIQRIVIDVRDQQLNVQHILIDEAPGGSFATRTARPGTPVLVMPHERLLFFAFYDAAVAGNILEVSHIGLLIPKGTLQLGFLNRITP